MKNQSLKKTNAEEEAVPGWYIVQSEPNRERVARDHLEGYGFEVYLPMRMCATKSKASMTPLFPRYLFVKLDLTSGHWPKVFSTPGVAAVMTQTTPKGSRPAVVRTNFVEALRDREINGVHRLFGVQVKAKPFPFEPGDKVKITRGYQGGELDAVYLARVDTNRVAILLSLIGRESRIVVQASTLNGS